MISKRHGVPVVGGSNPLAPTNHSKSILVISFQHLLLIYSLKYADLLILN